MIKKTYFMIFSIFMIAFFHGSVFARTQASLPQGLIEQEITTERGKRYCLKYVPKNLQDKPPLVVLLHGGGGSMRKLFKNNRSGNIRWLDLADRKGFILVAPNGMNPKNNDAYGNRQRWNDLRTTIGINRSNADDTGFIVKLIDKIVNEHGIDRKRVYVTGVSNGGMMTYRLLIEHPQSFACGVAFVANLPRNPIKQACLPTPIMIVNGTEDPLIPYMGGKVTKNRGSVCSTQDTVNYWLKVNNTEASSAQTQILKDVDPSDGCRVYKTQYPDSTGKTMVILIKVQGGGHYMPSSSAQNPPQIVKRFRGPNICRDIEGADLAWDFMIKHSR